MGLLSFAARLPVLCWALLSTLGGECVLLYTACSSGLNPSPEASTGTHSQAHQQREAGSPGWFRIRGDGRWERIVEQFAGPPSNPTPAEG